MILSSIVENCYNIYRFAINYYIEITTKFDYVVFLLLSSSIHSFHLH